MLKNTRGKQRTQRLTFGFADHHVAELALPAFIKALHLNVVGGLWLQVADRVPIPIPWKRVREPHVEMCIWFAWPAGAVRLGQAARRSWRHGGGRWKDVGENVRGSHHVPAVPSLWEGAVWIYRLNLVTPVCHGRASDTGHRSCVSWQPRFCIFSSPTARPLCQGRKLNHTKVFLTFHHILLVVAVVVTVCGSVIDIKAMDWGVVVTGWDIL